MFVSREFTFCASHILPRHPGKCSRLHGHNWRLIVEVTGPVQEESCFVMDYSELKMVVQPIVDRFDHRHMNCFVKYPSSENIAIHVAHLLRAQLNWENIDRLVIKVSETQNTWAVWDSNLQDDVDIFDAKTLDSADDQEDAEWRSPEIKDVPNIPMRIRLLEENVPLIFQEWEKLQIELEQLYLYKDSIDYQPELPGGVKLGGVSENEGEEVKETSESGEGQG